MFGKTVLIIKTILFWGLITVTLVEAGRQKKDVHHMIFVKGSRKPSKSHRHNDHDDHDYHINDRPKKSRKKHGGVKHQEPIRIEDSAEDISSSYEEFVTHKPKSKRHHHKPTSHSERHHKRHNSQRHHSDHKKHYRNDHNNHEKSKSEETHNNWVSISSKEFFGKEQNQYFNPSGLGQYAQGYIQSIPLEITTPLPLQQTGNFLLQSTIYPPLSLLNQKGLGGPQPSLIGTAQPYKPFDYSILEETPGGAYHEQDIASSNTVHVKHGGGDNKNPFSIIVENSRENLDNKEVKQKQKEKKNDAGRQGGKSKKIAGQGRRTRGGSRYRIRRKN